MVFGIFSACDDPDTAWDFLSTLYSADNQMQTGWLPATAAALEARLIQTAKYSSEDEADIAREIINGTTLAVGLNTQNVEQEWFLNYFSSPERVAVSPSSRTPGKRYFTDAAHAGALRPPLFCTKISCIECNKRREKCLYK